MKLYWKRTIAAQLHLIGCIAAMLGLVVLLHYTIAHNDRDQILASLAFGIPGILVFGASALYHFLSDGSLISARLDKWLEDLDHFAIYLFIAGSYTPVLMNTVAQPWRAIMLIGVWAVAISGILYTHFKPRLPLWAQHRFVYTSIFVLMGWLLLIRLAEVFHNLSGLGIFLLAGGGLAYTIGAVIYATKRPRLFADVFGFHELWHIMVMIGFGFHYFLILDFYKH
jgi:hemolysin III